MMGSDKTIFGLVAILLVPAGCTTVARGATESVRIESNPAGASVVVAKDGVTLGECGTTPCEVTLEREAAPFLVTFAKTGCQLQTLVLERDHTSGNTLDAGGVAGPDADAVSEAAHSIKPNPLVANLVCN